MSLIDIIIIAAVAAACVYSVILTARGKKQGKGVCGGCPYRDGCGKKECK